MAENKTKTLSQAWEESKAKSKKYMDRLREDPINNPWKALWRGGKVARAKQRVRELQAKNKDITGKSTIIDMTPKPKKTVTPRKKPVTKKSK